MSVEIPRFIASLEADQVIVTAPEHPETPDVLFEMLGVTSLRHYNMVTPKEENLYLEPLVSRPEARKVNSELATEEIVMRTQAVINSFGELCGKLENISGRQLDALLKYARISIRNSVINQ